MKHWNPDRRPFVTDAQFDRILPVIMEFGLEGATEKMVRSALIGLRVRLTSRQKWRLGWRGGRCP